jgi:HAE1 family hydrophobic/amphiphilic exporter-1
MCRWARTPYQASLDGTQEIGLAVLATTFSIVAVFLPIGFMGGIIGKFFHEFGITIVAAVLISMFVSFTLDPMLSSRLARPQHRGPRQTAQPPTLYDKTIGRVTGWFDRGHRALSEAYQGILRWSLVHKLATLAPGAGGVRHQHLDGAAAGHRVRAQGRLFGNHRQLLHPGGLVAGGDRSQGAAGGIHRARAPGGALHAVHHQHRQRPGQDLRQHLRAPGGPQGPQPQCGPDVGVLRERLRQVPGITVTHVGLLDSVGGNKQIEFSLQGPDLKRTGAPDPAGAGKLRPIPGLVDLDSSVKPDKPVLDVEVKRDVASDLGLSAWRRSPASAAHAGGRPDGGQLARPDDQTYDVNVRLAPEARNAPQDLERLPFATGTNADGSDAHRAAEPGGHRA